MELELIDEELRSDDYGYIWYDGCTRCQRGKMIDTSYYSRYNYTKKQCPECEQKMLDLYATRPTVRHSIQTIQPQPSVRYLVDREALDAIHGLFALHNSHAGKLAPKSLYRLRTAKEAKLEITSEWYYPTPKKYIVRRWNMIEGQLQIMRIVPQAYASSNNLHGYAICFKTLEEAQQYIGKHMASNLRNYWM